MVRCSYCGKVIPKGTRYYKGASGGKYHIACGSHIKKKSIAYTK
jgi:ribosomal protein L24E